MLDISKFTDKSIKQILTKLEKKTEVNALLPGVVYFISKKRFHILLYTVRRIMMKALRDWLLVKLLI
ncbi:hypothetical protein [Antarcticibacterium flavum]|uniref:hypothetical protein n=1 Tax=Antarcticibacterium flavum TaxID=2058175 RepID=UPI001FE9E3C2|nr:hypothetical protein [Antarcticibacterium flavum]